MKKFSILIAFILFTLMVKAGENENYDVYLMIGQSNMAGRGELETQDTTEIMEGVYLLDADGNPIKAKAPFNKYSSIRKDIGLQGYSPANKFAELTHSRSGKKILIVSNARGGSSIDQWQPGDKHHFFDEAVRRTRQAMRYGRLKGIAWHQGETDIQKGMPGYVEKFKTMISALRDSLGEGDIPVVIGQVGQWGWAPATDIETFNDSIIPKIVKEIRNSRYVSSNNLQRRYKDNEKDPHFGRRAQKELGRRYADAMTELTDSVYVTKFKDGKSGAVSFTFDDGDLDHYLLAAPELEKRGFRGTFWIIGDKIDKGDSVRPRMTWEQLKEMSQRGHEISNHSFTHPKLVQMKPEEARREIEMNDSAIQRNVGTKPLTFCYPFNGYPDWLVNIAEEGRVGSRTHQTGVGQQNNKSTIEKLRKWTDGVISNGEMGVTMIHGITMGYDKWYNPQELWDFFDFVKQNEHDIWVATFCDVSKYEKTRDNMVVTVDAYGNDIVVTSSSLLENTLFDAPVTVAIKGEWQIENVKISRGNKELIPKVKDNLLLFDMFPTDRVVITKL